MKSVVLALGLLARSLAAQETADDQAKFNAKAVLISARVMYLTRQSYAGVTPQTLQVRNPELRLGDDAASSGPAVVSVKVVGAKQVRIAVYGAKTCWGIREEGRGSGVATLYAKRQSPPRDCTASSFKEGDFVEHEDVWQK